MASRARSGVIYATVLVVVAAVAAILVRVLWNSTTASVTYEHCTVGSFDLLPDQASVAATMIGVVTTRDLPERAAVLALAAGLQESKLENLPPNAGDRDSVGVLQQRPSQGWGTPTQLNDIHYATGAFLDALLKIPNWQQLDVATAVQDVQISADPTAYAEQAPEAQALADALTGKVAAGISCVFDKPTVVASTASVAAKLRSDLPVNPPAVSAETVSVPGASWTTVAWFVANAQSLGIDSVAYDGMRWTRAQGWHSATTPASSVVATMTKL